MTPSAIARWSHLGQFERCGRHRNYTEHVEGVVALVSTDDERSVAWLHDVIEDTPLSAVNLEQFGVPKRVIDAVVLLTRDKAEPYEDYIQSIVASSNQLAIAVKIADLREHLHPSCPDRLRPRYEAALKVLTAPTSGIELDRRMREILTNVTPETSLSSSAALVELGFSAAGSFDLVCQAIKAKDKR